MKNHSSLPNRLIKAWPAAPVAFLCFTALSAQEKMSNLGFDFSTGVVYDSNVDLRPDGEDDFYALARVGANYWRRVGGHRLGVDAHVQHEEYAELSEHSDTNFGFGIVFDPSIDRQDADFTYDLDIILRQENVDDEAAGRRVNTFTYGASGSVRYNPNRRWSLSGQTSYRNTDSDGAGLLDRERYGGGSSFYYHYSPRLSIVTSVNAEHATANRSRLNTGLDQDDYWIYTVSTGLSGRLLPKLTGSASVGAQYTSGSVTNQDWTPYASVSLSYAYDSTTAFSVSVSRSIVDTSTDLSTEATSITIGATRQMRRDLSASVYASYTVQELDSPAFEPAPGVFIPASTREDEIFAIGASVNYKVAAWGSLIFDLRRQDKQSDQSNFDYDKLVASARLSWNW